MEHAAEDAPGGAAVAPGLSEVLGGDGPWLELAMAAFATWDGWCDAHGELGDALLFYDDGYVIAIHKGVLIELHLGAKKMRAGMTTMFTVEQLFDRALSVVASLPPAAPFGDGKFGAQVAKWRAWDKKKQPGGKIPNAFLTKDDAYFLLPPMHQLAHMRAHAAPDKAEKAALKRDVINVTALNEAMQAVALERDARCASPSTQSAASLSAELSKFGEAAVAENVDVAWRSGAIATTTAEVSSSSPRCCHEPFQTWCPRSWR